MRLPLLASALRRRRAIRHLVYDTFSRQDNSSVLGVAESGQPWLPNSGSFGVKDGQAYTTTVGFAQRNVNAGVSDFAVEADVLWRTGDTVALCLRGKAVGTDRIFLQMSTTLSLGKTLSSVNSTLGSWTMTPVDGRTYRFRVEARGTLICAYLDGVLRIVANETDLMNETHAGISFFTSGAAPLSRFDNFLILR